MIEGLLFLWRGGGGFSFWERDGSCTSIMRVKVTRELNVRVRYEKKTTTFSHVPERKNPTPGQKVAKRHGHDKCAGYILGPEDIITTQESGGCVFCNANTHFSDVLPSPSSLICMVHHVS